MAKGGGRRQKEGGGGKTSGEPPRKTVRFAPPFQAISLLLLLDVVMLPEFPSGEPLRDSFWRASKNGFQGKGYARPFSSVKHRELLP